RFFGSTEDGPAAHSVAIFPLVCNVGHRCPSRSFRVEWARGPEHRMSHPRTHHWHRLVGRAGAGPRAAAFRRGDLVHGHDRRRTRPNLDRRLGTARACRSLAPRDSWRRGGKGAAVFSVLRPRTGDWLPAWSAGMAFVFILLPPA